ncbi:hypothetical protein Moror_10151 [Moniliophthora roreri MCA 2997]|uniref:Uncharacterized protein n=1 Tax=Moniliophthora roreri (strain MCA 2997) TaxID=1381753 RepID=V2WC30_MONRO|nr:hypothetical protein Moror_10151 [Moniliophthora roreri MCA 2997]
MLQQQYHVHFISMSQHASIGEQFHTSKKVIESTHTKPIPVLDPTTYDTTLFRLFVHSAPSDNPMQSEISAHMGSHAWDSMLSSVPFWIEDLIDRFKSIKSQNQGVAPETITKELEVWVSSHNNDIYSGFLTHNGFDPTLDTSIKLLHTILLGIVNLFALYDLVNGDLLQVWKTVGELSALLWFPEICHLDMYLSDIETAVANVLDSFAVISPSKIPMKIKLHLVVHLRQDIECFGPLVSFTTELFELFNSVFQLCSIFSNHLAPSWDIAIQLADQEGLKQQVSNGWWYSKTASEWVQEGVAVQQFAGKQKTL